MSQRGGIFLAVGGILGFLLGGIVAALLFPLLSPNQIILAVVVAAFIIGGILYALVPLVRPVVAAPKQLAGDIQIMMSANPAHRIPADGPATVRELAAAINAFADRAEEIQSTQSEQIAQAQAGLEDEKNKLAALIAQLAEGILVCNSAGRILLYNPAAVQLLGRESSDAAGGFVGLGRSVFALVDRHAISQAADQLAHRLRQNGGAVQPAQFVVVANNGQIVKARMSPVLNRHGEMRGFILNLADAARESEANYRRYLAFHNLSEWARSSLTNIRAAIEIINQYPDITPASRGQFQSIILEESVLLSNRLAAITAENAADIEAVDWRMAEIFGADLLWAIENRLQLELKLTVDVSLSDEPLWLKVDSYSIVLVMQYIAGRLRDEFGLDAVQLRLQSAGHLAAFDLAWPRDRANLDAVWSWLVEEEQSALARIPVSVSLVAEAHGGEVWCQVDELAQLGFFRLLLPTIQPETPPEKPAPVTPESPPASYDFSLLRQIELPPELADRVLSNLTFTVFDTETTGLNPSKGDEIISISAVRMVNGRLLRHEVFDRLVNPQRSLPRTATEITGITADMLTGQPPIGQILPEFFEFARDTVLVAHNAAFDMRCLQLKEAQTGVKFKNPVLDTMLLSSVLHPHTRDHSVDAIAERLGVDIIERHTSLGDSLVTGEILLKMIPLLAARNLRTLADAHRASQESPLAQIKY